MILYAPAKVNLHLRVVNKRPDGYHNIETLFERIKLFDKITLRSLKDDKIKISCDNPSIPLGKKSIIYRTVTLLKNKFHISNGIEIKIFKRIPIAAGLGGGSSDAACVLKGLNKLWKLSLDTEELKALGKKLGSDVPFFIGKSSFSLAKERGDKIFPLKWRKKLWHLLVFPGVELLSRDIYGAYSRKRSSGLTKRARLNRILSPGKRAVNLGYIENLMQNDLEEAALEKAPILREVKKALNKIGTKNSLVSGSGPSVFSIFEKRKEAISAKKSLMKRLPVIRSKGWQTFVASTL